MNARTLIEGDFDLTPKKIKSRLIELFRKGGLKCETGKNCYHDGCFCLFYAKSKNATVAFYIRTCEPWFIFNYVTLISERGREYELDPENNLKGVWNSSTDSLEKEFDRINKMWDYLQPEELARVVIAELHKMEGGRSHILYGDLDGEFAKELKFKMNELP